MTILFDGLLFHKNLVEEKTAETWFQSDNDQALSEKAQSEYNYKNIKVHFFPSFFIISFICAFWMRQSIYFIY